MYSIKFNDINFSSNKKNILSRKTIILFYGIGCSSSDFSFLLRYRTHKYQLIIPELPGHNNFYYLKKQNLKKFAETLVLFLKKKGIYDIIYFGHSVGGILPIMIEKKIIRHSKVLRKFINYEGNLTSFDTGTITKKTASYQKDNFQDKFKNLVMICQKSDSKGIRLWAKSLKKTDFNAFYFLSKETVKLSKTKYLLNPFRSIFKRKVFVSGSKTKFYFSELFFGSIRYKINYCGHFSFFENSYEFLKIFSKLINGRI